MIAAKVSLLIAIAIPPADSAAVEAYVADIGYLSPVKFRNGCGQ